MSGGIFFGINIALQGMMAQQTALNVTSHNIANANTPGYTRQRANMETSIPVSGLSPGAGQLGSGVTIAEIQRIRDDFLDYQIRGESSTKGKWEALRNNLEEVETIFMEPSDTGFNEVLNEFWNAWQELSKFAESSPVRTIVKESAVSLAESFRHMHSQLSDIKNNIQDHINMKITDINSITEQIARLNDQIVNIKLSGDNPNDLLDRRDQLLDELAVIGDITITNYTNTEGNLTGAVKVELGNAVLVDSDGSHEIVEDAGSYTVDGNVFTVGDGELAGLQKAGGDGVDTDTVQYYLDKLNTLAVGLAKAINDLHTQGKTLSGDDGDYFFVFLDENGDQIDLNAVDWNNPFADGLSAGNIYVNPDIKNNVSNIAAAGEDASNGGLFFEGNGDTALEIAKLKDAYFEYDVDNKTLTRIVAGGTTFGDFYKDMIAELGVATSEAARMTTNQEALVQQLETRRESLSGVSLDEEMANTIRYQHVFQANARVISIMDELLDTIVNRM